MARNQQITVDKNFIGGRISEATALNFPENACVDELNCVFDERGYVRRRFGIDFETGFQSKTIDRTGRAITSFLWKNASGDGKVDLAVVQVGSKLYFYVANSASGFSQNALSTTVDLTTFTPAEGVPAPVEINECQYSNGLSFLFVTHPCLDPIYVTYNNGTQTATGNRINIQIRDTEGIADSTTIEERPVALSPEHKYNLINQGWDNTKITAFQTALAVYPSNADVWWIFRDAVTGLYDPTVEGSFNRGNAPAPKGHFILTAFNQDRTTVSGGLVLGAAKTTSGNRPSTVAFYAGRVFYAGISSSTFATKILFSQIIENSTDFDRHHQKLDPSSETAFDLLPTDGGIINIPETGIIYKLVPFGDSLLIFAHNGVWAVSGSQGIGFTATDYSVTQVSTVKSISGNSFVLIDGSPTWWNVNGIYSIGATPDRGIQVQSLTDKTIKTFYRDLPFLSKQQARGVYNPISKLIQWIYNSTSQNDVTTIYDYDSVLNYNVLTGAFYTWKKADIVSGISNPRIHGLMVADTGGGVTLSSNQVVQNLGGGAGNKVIDAAGNKVVTFGLSSLPTESTNIVTKILVSYVPSSTFQFTWAESQLLNGYKDWGTALAAVGGASYDSFFITGYKIPTNLVNKFQINYLFTVSDAPEETAYHVQTQWDFANSPDVGRWSSRSLVSFAPTGYDFKRSKLWLRGNGHALSLLFSSVDNTGFSIAGWGMYQTGNTTP